MEKETKTNNDEPMFRLNIKQSAKGFAYYDVTVRADSKEELQQRVNEAVEVATIKCAQINATLQNA